MGKVGTTFLLSQLGYHAPALVVYLLALILALVYRSRATAASVLTLIGVGILVVTTLGAAVAQAWIVDSQQATGRSHMELGRLMATVGITGSCVKAMGPGLLVAAIFVGRRDVLDDRSDPDSPPDHGQHWGRSW